MMWRRAHIPQPTKEWFAGLSIPDTLISDADAELEHAMPFDTCDFEDTLIRPGTKSLAK